MSLTATSLLSKTLLLTVDGKSLTEARIAANLSMDAAAVLIGCNKSSVSRWEQGKLVPSVQRMFSLAKIYGTQGFIKLNERATVRDEHVAALKKIFNRSDVMVVDGLDYSKYMKKEDLRRFHGVVGDQEYFRMKLNGKIELTPEDIESVRKLMEG